MGFESPLSPLALKEAAMSGRKRKKYTEPFYMLTAKMMKSKAWEELDSYDKEAFMHISIKYKGNNKGR